MDIVSDIKTAGRTARRITTFKNGWVVQTWWDRRSVSWITQIQDDNRYQRDINDPSSMGGGAGYAGSGVGNKWAKQNHDMAVENCQKLFSENA